MWSIVMSKNKATKLESKSFHLVDRTGRLRARLVATASDSAFQLFHNDLSSRISIEVDGSDMPRLALTSRDFSLVNARALEFGAVTVVMFDQRGVVLLQLGVTNNGDR